MVANLGKPVWASFNKVVKLMALLSMTERHRMEFPDHVVEFMTTVTNTWGERNTNHYMICRSTTNNVKLINRIVLILLLLFGGCNTFCMHMGFTS